jgi:acyl-CoA oxidase
MDKSQGERPLVEVQDYVVALAKAHTQTAALEHGYLESPKAKAIGRLINELGREVRPQAVPLVYAFGIPDPVQGARIAFPP